MQNKLNAVALGLAGGKLAALWMLVLSIGNALGVYTSAVEQMQNWHMFYTPTVVGTITGMIEAFIWTFIGGYLLGLLYNKFANKGKGVVANAGKGK